MDFFDRCERMPWLLYWAILEISLPESIRVRLPLGISVSNTTINQPVDNE